jgi:hypothetical protein
MNGLAQGLLERVRRFAMPEGDVEARDIRLSQQGEMRLAPDAPWRLFQAEPWMSGSSIDFRGGPGPGWFRSRPFSWPTPSRPEPAAERCDLRPPADRPRTRVRLRPRRGPCALSPSCPGGRSRSVGCRNVTWEVAGEGGLRATFDDNRTRACVDLDIGGEGRALGGSASATI